MATARAIAVEPIPGDVNLTQLWRDYGAAHRHRPSEWLSTNPGRIAEQEANYEIGFGRLVVYKGNPEIPYNERYRVDTFAHPVLARLYEAWLASKGPRLADEPAGPLFDHRDAPSTVRYVDPADLKPGDEVKVHIGGQALDGTFSGYSEEPEEESPPTADIMAMVEKSKTFGVPMDRAFGPRFHVESLSAFLKSTLVALDLIVANDERIESLANDQKAWQHVNDTNVNTLVKRIDRLDSMLGNIHTVEATAQVARIASDRTLDLRRDFEEFKKHLAAKLVDEAMARWSVERTREWAYVQTLTPFAITHGVNLTVNDAVREGKILAAYCRSQNLSVREYLDPRGFKVFVYPGSALKWWLADYQGRNPPPDPFRDQPNPSETPNPK